MISPLAARLSHRYRYRARKQAVVAPVSGAAVSRDTVPARLSYFVLGRSGTGRQQLPMAPDSCKMAAWVFRAVNGFKFHKEYQRISIGKIPSKATTSAGPVPAELEF